MDACATVIRYYEPTKHRLTAYARGLETLDCDAQPALLLFYDGATWRRRRPHGRPGVG